MRVSLLPTFANVMKVPHREFFSTVCNLVLYSTQRNAFNGTSPVLRPATKKCKINTVTLSVGKRKMNEKEEEVGLVAFSDREREDKDEEEEKKKNIFSFKKTTNECNTYTFNNNKKRHSFFEE
jgi:hypothetical protein